MREMLGAGGKPNLDDATKQAARIFLSRLEGRYSAIDALVYGSRARGTHKHESDADLAVILRGRCGDRFEVSSDMAGIAFDVMQETGVLIDPLPIWEGEWKRPSLFSNPALLRHITRDGLRP